MEAYLNAAISGNTENLPKPISRIDYLLCELIKTMNESKDAEITIPLIDTSTIDNMDKMFEYSSLTTIPSLDTSNVTSMSNMFHNCYSLTTIPSLDTSNVTSMSNMFHNCYSLTTIPSLDTSKVTTMDNMFYNCYSLTTIPSLDTSKVTTMEGMFYNCHSLTTISLLDRSKIQNFGYAFANCYSLTTIEGLNMVRAQGMQTYTQSTFLNCRSLTNCYLYNIYISIQIGSGTSYGHLLTMESLLHIIKELIDGWNCTLTVGSANLEKLANIYVKTIDITDEMKAEDPLIDKKKPFEVCESTDEGAMKIAEYASSKGWTLA